MFLVIMGTSAGFATPQNGANFTGRQLEFRVHRPRLYPIVQGWVYACGSYIRDHEPAKYGVQ